MKQAIKRGLPLFLVFSLIFTGMLGSVLPRAAAASEEYVDVYAFTDITAALNYAASGDTINFYIKNDIAFASAAQITKTGLTINLINDSGEQEVTLSISGGGSFRHFLSNNIAEVTLNVGAGIVLDGDETGGGIEISGSGCSLALSGCTITNCVSGGNGGGVSAANGSVVIKDDTLISNCKAGSGGGVFGSDCEIIIDGGIITGNTANMGGGILGMAGSTITLNGGEVQNNTAIEGGGIYAYNTGLYINDGCEISGNKATAASGKGGGVLLMENVSGATKLIMNGGTIRDNMTYNYGGGIMAESNITELTINGGLITGNKATSGGSEQGGGIYVDGGNTLIINGGTISDNEAYSGGGIFVNGSTLTVTGGVEISNNIASDKGGGICGYGTCSATIQDGSIIKNNEALSGGGIANFTSVIITDSVISGNKATVSEEDIEELEQLWSGWYLPQTPANFGITLPNDTWLDYVILNYGGGGGIYSKGTVEITNSQIIDNISNFDGGGIYTADYGSYDALTSNDYQKLTISASTVFSGNTASRAYVPPEIATSYTNIKYGSTSIVSGGEYVHPINNYDINYRGNVRYVTVTYNANGGTGDNYKDAVEDGGYTVLGNDTTGFAKTDYTFKCWSTSADGRSDTLSPGETFTVDKDIIFYAQWTANSSNGGSTGSGNKPETTPPEPTAPAEPTDPVIDIGGGNTVVVGGGSGREESNPYDNIVIIGEGDTPLGSLEFSSHLRYINGYPDMTVRPEQNITRAEVAAIFYRLLSDENKAAVQPRAFPDVPDSAWYSEHINYLASLGIVLGYEDGNFCPDTPITRAEFAAIASRFDNLILTTGTAFMDVPEDHWAVKYINSNYIRSWIDGYEDYSFKPEQSITRAEVVKIVNTMLTRLPNELPEDINPYTDITESHWAYIYMMEASMEHDYSRDDATTEYWTWYNEFSVYVL